LLACYSFIINEKINVSYTCSLEQFICVSIEIEIARDPHFPRISTCLDE